MKRIALLVVLGLVGVVLAAVPSEAARLQVRLYEPRLVTPDTAVLKGRVTGRDAVVIQRFARARDRWVRVRSVPADRRGYFRTRVAAKKAATWYRARAGRAFSTRRLVQSPIRSTSEPPAPELVPVDACGPQPTKADGTLWSCTLAENFGGTELNRDLWTPQTQFTSGSSSGRPCYIDDKSVVEVADGALHLRLKEVLLPMICPEALPYLATNHIAGGVMTHRRFSQKYGRFEARFKNTAATVPGLHEAFWLWPDDRYSTGYWPAAGEIDIAETYSQYPHHVIPFLHYTANDNGGPTPGLNTAWNCAAERGVYNTYTLEWSASRLEILVNGKPCLVNTSGDPAFQKPYIIALTQLMGTAGNAYDGRAPLPAEMTVDYVKVWE